MFRITLLNSDLSDISSDLTTNISNAYIHGTGNTGVNTVKIIPNLSSGDEYMFIVFTGVTNNTTPGVRIIKGKLYDASAITTTRLSGNEGNALQNSDKTITVPHDNWAHFLVLGLLPFKISIN